MTVVRWVIQTCIYGNYKRRHLFSDCVSVFHADTLRAGEDGVGIWRSAVQHTPHHRRSCVRFWKWESEIRFPSWPGLLQWLTHPGETYNRSNLRKKSHGHFLHAGKKLPSRLIWCHIFINQFTFISVLSSKHVFFYSHIHSLRLSSIHTLSCSWLTRRILTREVTHTVFLSFLL